MRAATRIFALLVVPAVLAGCAAPVVPAAAGRDGAATSSSERAPWIDRVLFTFRADAPIRSSPLVHDGTLYVGSHDGRLYAIDAKSGAERWRYATGAPVASAPAWADGKVYVVSRDGHLYCLDAADGRLRWRYRFGAELGAQNYWDYALSSPVVMGGRVYVGAGDGGLYALDAASGAPVWRFDAGARIRSTPAVGAGLVVVGTLAGRVVGVDAASGALRWSFATDGASQAFEYKNNDTTSIFAAPTIAGALVTIGARDGNFYAVELATGKLAWRATHDGASWILATAFDGTTLYVGSGSALIVQAVDPASGAERWRFKTRGAVFAPLALARDTLLFNDFVGTLYAVDSGTGSLRWQFPLGSRSLAAPVLADGVVYAATDSGELFALAIGAGASAHGPAPRRLVHWEGMKSAAAFAWFRNDVDRAILGQLKAAGYEQVTAAELASFMRSPAAKAGPSVVVFADDKMPAELLEASGGKALIRAYLEGGGKVALLGPNPVIYKTDPVSGELTDIDHTAPLAVFGVRHPPPNIASGYYVSMPTAAGRAMGLRAPFVSFLAVDPQQGDGLVPLALDEFGKASAWLKSYGGPAGSGLLQLAVSRTESVDLQELLAAIEFGIGW